MRERMPRGHDGCVVRPTVCGPRGPVRPGAPAGGAAGRPAQHLAPVLAAVRRRPCRRHVSLRSGFAMPLAHRPPAATGCFVMKRASVADHSIPDAHRKLPAIIMFLHMQHVLGAVLRHGGGCDHDHPDAARRR